jgi:methionyl-tRNA formyltransferase
VTLPTSLSPFSLKKVIFFGSSDFAIPSINALFNGLASLALVVTAPPKQAGRGRNLKHVPVATWAKERGLPLLETDRANDPQTLEALAAIAPDIIIVCAYGTFLGKKLLSMGKVPPINIHPSLLPRHRGPAPINWSIIQGDKECGVSIIFLEREMDAGPILGQKSIPLKEGTPAPIIAHELSLLSASLLEEVLKQLNDGTSKPQVQDSSRATVNRLLEKRDGYLNFQLPAETLASLINGVDPWPGAQALLEGKMVKFYEATSSQGQGAPGEVLGAPCGRITIGTGNGLLEVKKLQPEGKKSMSAPQFISGYRPRFFSSLA